MFPQQPDAAALMRKLTERPPPEDAPLAERRRLYDAASAIFKLPENVTIEHWTAGGLAGELLIPEGAASSRLCIFFHGGGYGVGSCASHRHLAAAIAIAAGMPVLMPEYRLAPENTFPAAFDDCLSAYARIADQDQFRDISLAGDSAGGGLALATALAAKTGGLRLPSAIACMSPWIDLSCSTVPSEVLDPLVPDSHLESYASAYLDGADPRDVKASPVWGNLGGLPRMLVQASSIERLRSDSELLVQRAKDAGIDCAFEVYEGVPHVWQWYWPRLEAGRVAIEHIGRFLSLGR